MNAHGSPKNAFRSPYALRADDYRALMQLGLRQDHDRDPMHADREYDHGKFVRLGTVSNQPGWQADTLVHIDVCFMPAVFWRFTVHSNTVDVHNGILSTGSGSLLDFWPTVNQGCAGSIHFTPERSEREESIKLLRYALPHVPDDVAKSIRDYLKGEA